MTVAKKRIDAYARNMFAYESLHDTWIDKCQGYLEYVFGGDSLKGATVIDYAFGRGNWSAAFIQAGAERVYSIDASQHNCDKLKGWCAKNGVKGIEIIHADVLADDLSIENVDILWLYGILHHIAEREQPLFLKKLSSMLNQDSCVALIYAYERHSLRQLIVDSCRNYLRLDSFEAFAEVSFFFTPAARLRARDDLTAPEVRWMTEAEIVSSVTAAGPLKPKARLESFQQFTSNAVSDEFAPHHLLMSASSQSDYAEATCLPNLRADLAILSNMIQSIEKKLSGNALKNFAIGLFNTHFSVDDMGDSGRMLINDFSYLLYVSRYLDIFQSQQQPLDQIAGAEYSYIAKHLSSNNIRL